MTAEYGRNEKLHGSLSWRQPPYRRRNSDIKKILPIFVIVLIDLL